MSYCLELTRETGSDLWLQVFCDLQIDEWWDRQESWWWKGVSVKTFLLVPQARCLCLHVKEINNESHFDIYFLLRTSSQHCQDVLPAEAWKRLCYAPNVYGWSPKHQLLGLRRTEVESRHHTSIWRFKHSTAIEIFEYEQGNKKASKYCGDHNVNVTMLTFSHHCPR